MINQIKMKTVKNKEYNLFYLKERIDVKERKRSEKYEWKKTK